MLTQILQVAAHSYGGPFEVVHVIIFCCDSLIYINFAGVVWRVCWKEQEI